MRKTIIISSNLSKEYKEHLLKETDISFGTQILPFDAFFFNTSLNQDLQLYHAYSLINKHHFQNLEDLFSFPLTLKSLIAFNKELQCYQIDYSNLPTQNQYDIEIKEALKLLHQDIKLPDNNTYFISQGLSHAQLTYLRSHNVTEIKNDDWLTNPESTSFKSGLNVRLEIEGLIQHLLRDKVKNPLVLVPNLSESIPYFKAILARHNIPYTAHSKTLKAKVFQFLALLDYYESPNMTNITKVIESLVFDLKYPKQLLQYLSFYRVTYDQFQSDLNFVVDDYLLNEFYQVQSLIQNDHEIIKQQLSQFESLTLQEALIAILEIVKSKDPLDALPIQNLLQNTFSAISNNTLHILKQSLEYLPKESLSTPFLTLGSYSDLPLFPKDNLFILGLNAKNYPGISAPTGILDLSYRNRVSGYPAQDILNEHQLHHKELLFRKANTLILSVHELNFEGKSLEFSNRILDEALRLETNFTPWVISELDPNHTNSIKLSPEIAKELYLGGNRLLRGSVSSFEKYVNDPYMYFIENGLRLKQPLDYNLYPRLRGSINHKILETGIIDTKEKLFPQNDTYVPHFNRINKRELDKHLDFLASIDETGLLKPHKRELKIKSDDLFAGISFTGYIDRIDKLHDDTYLIIDYKSSENTLSKAELEKGTQLQLITYVLAYKQTLEEKAIILGSYYYIFDKKKADTPKANRYTFAKTKGIAALPALNEESLSKNYGIKGWTYEAIAPELVPDNLFAGKTLTTIFDLDKIEEFMVEMYQHLKEKILGGVLDINELELPFRKVDIKGDKK